MNTDKKIGIATFHNAHNYGAVLQVYALQKILSKKYEVKIINYRNKAITNVYKLFKVNKKNVFTIIKSLLTDFIYYSKDKKRFDEFEKFINNNLHMTQEYNTEEKLKTNPPKFDIYITGSDQVWNYDIARNIDVYTLNFGEKSIKRIAYAASIGEDTLYNEFIQEYKNNIQKIDHISVREEQAKLYLEKIIDESISVTLDPTLLINGDEWSESIDNKEQQKEKYIFAYIVEENEEFYKILNYLSEITGYKIIHTGRKNRKIKNVLENAYIKGPMDFIKLIKNSEYVIATSFHATVFSILFHKKFWIIPHLKKGGRVFNLLNKLNIADRTIKNFEEFKFKDYDATIDYAVVDNILNVEREKSKKWLEDAINN